MFGPISDVIPSSSAFDMYPVGFTSIADYLENHGHRVQIVNLAQRMLADPSYDGEAEIARLRAPVVGIDLHWLPHAHGCLEVARLVKKYHPRTKVLLGGLSASYYHEELIQRPEVDLVLRGDSTEEPMAQLLNALEKDATDLSHVPNLTWKDHSGAVQVNPLGWVPEDLDQVQLPGYRYVVRSVLRYRRLRNFIPYKGWLEYPNTALLTVRGCTQNCLLCGGSASAYNRICNRQRPAFRSPEALREDIRFIRQFSRAPIFVIGDIRQAGDVYAGRLLDYIRQDAVPNEMVFELFGPADASFFQALNRSCARYSLEMTLESHEEAIRRRNGKFAVANGEVESTIRAALQNGCGRLDIFFMTGLPGQTPASALATADYCRHLLEQNGGDRRLSFFLAPLAPFLDPGSRAFEDPERYGYRLMWRTLEEHRQALLAPSWQYMLNYETQDMDRRQIVAATYQAAARLNDLKGEFGLVAPEVHAAVSRRIAQAQAVLEEISRIQEMPDADRRQAALGALRERMARLNKDTLCTYDELKWPARKHFASPLALARLGVSLLGDALRIGPAALHRSLEAWRPAPGHSSADR